MATQSPYNNSDGLLMKFGAEESKSLHGAGHVAGHFMGEQCLEVEINLVHLTQTEVVLNYAAWLPHDALITHVRTLGIVTPTETGTALLNVGYGHFATAGSSTLTVIQTDGIINTMVIGSMAVGEVQDFALASDGSINDAYLNATATGGSDTGTEIISTVNRYYLTGEIEDSNTFDTGVLRVQVYYIPQGVQKTNTPT